MNLEQIVKKMSESQWSLTNSKGFLARRWHCSEEDIAKAKEIVRGKIDRGKLASSRLYGTIQQKRC